MALASTVVVEIRASSGDDSFGGGFDPAIAGGTDYSQQNSAQVVFDGTVITGTTAGASATLTVTGATVDASWAGNLVKVSGGVNVTTGFFEIISVNVGANTITFDRNVATGVASGFAGKLGGAHKTISNFFKGSGGYVSGNTGYLKAEADYAEQIDVSAGALPLILIGYTTTRTDNGRATITGSNARTSCFKYATGQATFYNILFTGPTTSIFESTAASQNVNAIFAVNCKMEPGVGTATKGVTSAGSTPGGAPFRFFFCEIAAFTLSPFLFGGTGIELIGCDVHDNTGATSDGITSINAAGPLMLFFNLIRNNGRDGLRITSTFHTMVCWNIFRGNGGIGANFNAAAARAVVLANRFENNSGGGVKVSASGMNNGLFDYNSFYNTGTAYTNVTGGSHDITLSSDPAVSSTDLSANKTAGGGASVRDVFPLSFALGTSVSLDAGIPHHPPVLPAQSDVLEGVQYGDAGTEFTGTLAQNIYGQTQTM